MGSPGIRGPAVARADPLAVELLMSEHLLGRAEDEWRALAEAAGVPFTTPEWLRAWLAHQAAARPAVAAVRDGEGRLVGVLPLVLSRRAGVRTLHFAGDELGDAFGPVVAAGTRAELVALVVGRAFAAGGPAWDVARLAHVDGASPWPAAFAAGLGSDVRMLERRRVEAPFIVRGDEGWEEYMAGRRRSFRKEARRRRRRIEEDATHRFAGAGDLDPRDATRELFRLHDMRWTHRGGSSVASEASRAAITDFNAAASERGWFGGWQLEIDGRPAAAELAWRIGGRQTHWQGGFDPAHAARGVGIVLFAHAIEAGFDAGVRTFDLGWGTSAYKMDFATGIREAVTLLLVRARHPARAALVVAITARRAAKAVRALRGRVRR